MEEIEIVHVFPMLTVCVLAKRSQRPCLSRIPVRCVFVCCFVVSR
jgi:hypothetical protein